VSAPYGSRPPGVAAYVRVSSRSQDLASQRSAITRAARARGDKVGRWFAEKQSGRTLERPELGTLRAAVRRGDVRKLYVFCIDRLTRSGIRDTLAVLEELRGNGCVVVSVTDPFELAGPASEIVIAVMSWCAQQERARIGERISAARARVEAEGGRWGRPRRVDSSMLRRMLELRAGGASVRAIARALKIPRATVHAALARAPQGDAPPSSRARGGA
jgi:DNA invertase Pin-like site-specific DNA recombinase